MPYVVLLALFNHYEKGSFKIIWELCRAVGLDIFLYHAQCFIVHSNHCIVYAVLLRLGQTFLFLYLLFVTFFVYRCVSVRPQSGLC